MNYKVIITGSVGSGKTTAVNSLTNNNAVLTDAVVSGSDQITKQHKETTTVAMDFDVIRLDDDNLVHVYGTPGQERFDFMWDILSQGAHGIILLLDITRNYPHRDLKYYISCFTELISTSRLIIGLTHTDIETDYSIESYKEVLRSLNIEADVVSIDARVKDDVTQLFYALLDIPRKSAKGTPESEIEPKVVEKKAPKFKSGNKKWWNFKTSFSQAKHGNSRTEQDGAINFTENILHEVAKVEHVNSVSITSSMGELLHTTTNDEELNDFIAFLSGITPEIESTLNRGKIHRIMLRSPKEENLTLFVENEKSLGVSSDRAVSVQSLSQQIEDLLQWL
jgi:signal recognition particle receptor subunit beta